MFYCQHCGFAVQKGQKFCTECGAKLDRVNEVRPPAQPLRPEDCFQKIIPPAPYSDGKPCGIQIDSATYAALSAAPAQPSVGIWQGAPARGAADPFADFLSLTERLLAGGATNEETYEQLSGTYANLRSKDVAGRQLLEQGRNNTAQDTLSNAFFFWALHTIYHMF